jgi:hypothetical protein
MTPFDEFEKNLERAYLLPQVVDEVVRSSVTEVSQITMSNHFALLEILTPETLIQLQENNDPSFLDLPRYMERAQEIKRSMPLDQTKPLREKAVQEINAIPQVVEAQRLISHQTLVFVCASFEAYCKDRFAEIENGKPAPQNVMNFRAIWQLFADHSKSLDAYFDVAALESAVRADSIDVDSFHRCFAYRHAIVHRFAVLDAEAVRQLGLPSSEIGKPIERFSLQSIQNFIRAINDVGRWINVHT